MKSTYVARMEGANDARYGSYKEALYRNHPVLLWLEGSTVATLAARV